jgi:hypothetical protein
VSMKDDLINNLHEIYRTDPWIIEIFQSAGLSLDEIIDLILKMYTNYWFDTMDELGISTLEKILDFKTNPNTPIEDRRSQLEARWKSNGKCDLNLLQQVANSWKNGDVEVKLVNGKIQIIFVGEGGVPADLQGLEDALEAIKPAHLGIYYVFKFLYWNLLESWNLTFNELETQNLTWDGLEAKVIN